MPLRRAPRPVPAVTEGGRHAAPPDGQRRVGFLVVTILTPFLLLGIIELALRLLVPAPAYPLFVAAPYAAASHLVANREVSRRWFPRIADPPRPMQDPFARAKSPGTLRLIVLGESSAAGFPYPRNGAFSRYLREALRRSMPDRTIEVVNLGIAATNSYAMWDLGREVAAEKPDAVLIYAGHNEYYGALGIGSSQAVAASRPTLTRAYLRALRFRTVWVLSRGLVAVRGARAEIADDVPGFMELLARDQQIAYGSAVYHNGVKQFRGNLQLLLAELRSHGIPVFVASIASNLADQPPFAADANSAPGGAREAYATARELLASGDTTQARALFARARDLDVVRFRAPSELNGVIRSAAAAGHARYVPAAESLAASSPGRIPGAAVFLEHVHPNRHGYATIARAFFHELLASGALDRGGTRPAAPDWDEIEQGVAVSPFDDRVALHTIRTITSRWPFVPLTEQRDYRAEYRPVDAFDSLAFQVSRGEGWERGKLALATLYQTRGMHDSAAAEYRGLAADAPLFQEPRVLLAEALLAAGKVEEGEAELREALRLGESPRVLAALGETAARRRAYPEAAGWLSRAADLQPDNPELHYRLALARAMAGNVAGARAAARRLQQIAPRHPALPELFRALGF